ncbi:hypothetical protein JW916_03260 [Candidatus Sumerlaeota bacterium]|nr:hypothetical protein [Candidatus Sumerlaeota bacterium]
MFPPRFLFLCLVFLLPLIAFQAAAAPVSDGPEPVRALPGSTGLLPGAVAPTDSPGSRNQPGNQTAEATLFTENFESGEFPPDGWDTVNFDVDGYTLATNWELDRWLNSGSDDAAYCTGATTIYAPTWDVLYMTDSVDCTNTDDVTVVFDYAVDLYGLIGGDAVYVFCWSSRTEAWVLVDAITNVSQTTVTDHTVELPASAKADDAEIWLEFVLDSYYDWANITIDDVEIRGTRNPDLLPYQPSTWDAPVVASTSTGTHTQNTVLVGQTVYIDVAVQNDSEESVDVSTDILYDLLDDTTLIAGGVTHGIDANSFISWEDIPYVFRTTGAHTVKIVADSGGDVTEFDEDNNTYELVVNVQANPDLPDLTVESTWWGPPNPTTLDSVSLGFNARNWGNLPAASCQYSVLVDGVQRATGTLPSISGGGGLHSQQNVSLGMLEAGPREIQIVVDPLDEVIETQEGNNTLVQTIQVASPPDLRVESAWYGPPSPDQTSEVRIGFNTRNDGPGDAGEALFVIREGANVLAIGGLPPIPAPGIETAQNVSVGRLAPGAHTLSVEVDPWNNIVEANESNNTFNLPITVEHRLSAGSEWMLY